MLIAGTRLVGKHTDTVVVCKSEGSLTTLQGEDFLPKIKSEGTLFLPSANVQLVKDPSFGLGKWASEGTQLRKSRRTGSSKKNWEKIQKSPFMRGIHSDNFALEGSDPAH